MEGGYRRASMQDLLAVKLLLLPVTAARAAARVYRYNISGKVRVVILI